MRPLALLAALWPALAAAEPLAETHFQMNFCWETGPGPAEAADRSDPAVSVLRLRREPAGLAVTPGEVAMAVIVTFRGPNGAREGDRAEGVAHCEAEDDRLRCRLPNRAGAFRLEAAGESGLTLDLDERGIRLEGREERVLREKEGEERNFALRRCG